MSHLFCRAAILAIAIVAGSNLSVRAQTHTFGISAGLLQTLPLGKRIEPNNAPPFQNKLPFPRSSFSLLYRYVPHRVGIETGLTVSYPAFSIEQTLINGNQYSVNTTLTPYYQLISLPVQAVFSLNQSSANYYQKWNWLVVAGPHVSLVRGSGFRVGTQLRGQGSIQNRSTNTFDFDPHWRMGIGAGIRLQPNSQRKHKVAYSLNWSSAFDGVRPWQASLTINGQNQLVQVLSQPLHTVSLGVIYCVGLSASKK